MEPGCDAPAAPAEAEGEKPAKTKSRSKSKKAQQKIVFKTPQVNMPAGKVHYFCSACMKGFEGDAEPEACPQGHRNDDPELSAPSGVTAAEEAEVTA